MPLVVLVQKRGIEALIARQWDILLKTEFEFSHAHYFESKWKSKEWSQILGVLRVYIGLEGKKKLSLSNFF